MSSKADIRHIVTQQVGMLRELSARGPLLQEDLDRLESLAKIAVTADRIEAGEQSDPDADSAALEKALTGG